MGLLVYRAIIPYGVLCGFLIHAYAIFIATDAV